MGESAPSRSTRNRSASATVRSRLETFHTRSVGEKLSNSTSRPISRWKSHLPGRNPLSRWRVGRLDGQVSSEPRCDMIFDDLELRMFLENISCELFEKSMPKTLELINQIYLVDKSISIPKRADDTTFNDVFRYTHAACASEIKHLMTILPLFVPFASQEDDIAAFRQITEFSDMNLYADAYRFKEFEDTAIFSRRPRVYLKEVRYHLKRLDPDASEISFPSGHKTPLMDMPITKWKSYAFDAMTSVICLLQGAIEEIITKRCEEAPSLQPYIMKTIFLQINQIFNDAKKSLSEELEFELVPYTDSFQHFFKIRDCLLDDYHLSCHLLNQTTEKTRDITKRFQKPKAKTNSWDEKIKACADAGAYLNLALANFLDKTSMIIEKDLLEQIELCDLFQLPVLPSPEMKELPVDDGLDEKFGIGDNSGDQDAINQPLEVAAQLAKVIERTMKDTAEELRLIDPFMKV